MAAPLEGILVVALEQAVAAPLCTARLAQGGARVIKVEREDGDFARGYDRAVQGESAYFVWLNGGKESIVLDFKRADDAALLHRIIDRADVFVQNLAPGAAARSGFGSVALRERHPRLITCDISGYGDEGPYADLKAYDFLVQCESGLASITGGPEAPGRVGVSVADIACGMNAHAGILQALYQRQHAGEGSAVAVSLFDALADWMTVPLLQHDYGGRAPERMGLNHPTIAPYGAYAAADGRQLVIAIQNEREWRTFCEMVLGQAELATDPLFSSNSARVANRPLLDELIRHVFGGLRLEQVRERLRDARTAFASLNSVSDLSRHAQLRRAPVRISSGVIESVASPIRVRGAAAGELAVPTLDEHGEGVRREFASVRR